MNQLTIRGFDTELLRRLKILARREGLSLNQAALKLMRRGAGLETAVADYSIGDAIEKYAGIWSDEEAREFEQAIQPFTEIDDELWR